MAKYPPLSPDQLEEAIGLYRSGKTLKQLGKRYGGRSHALMRRHLHGLVEFRRQGAPVKPIETKICVLSPEQEERAVALYQQENPRYSLTKVAEMVGTYAPVVRAALIKRGIERRKSHLGGVRRYVDAILIVNAAVREGDLVRGPCEHPGCGVHGFSESGRPAVIAHHDDYNLPLFVRWLCPLHHRQWHQSNMAIMVGEGPNADVGGQTLGEYIALYDLESTDVSELILGITVETSDHGVDGQQAASATMASSGS